MLALKVLLPLHPGRLGCRRQGRRRGRRPPAPCHRAAASPCAKCGACSGRPSASRCWGQPGRVGAGWRSKPATLTFAPSVIARSEGSEAAEATKQSPPLLAIGGGRLLRYTRNDINLTLSSYQAGGVALGEYQRGCSLDTKRISTRAFRAAATRCRKPRLGL